VAKGRPVSVRVDQETLKQVREMARRTDQSIGQVLSSLVDEGVRMRRCPGIIFTDGPTGRRATVAGSGIDVWEVIQVSRVCKSRRQLARVLPQLSEPQLDAALTYYACFPDEIDHHIKENEVCLTLLQRRSGFIARVAV